MKRKIRVSKTLSVILLSVALVLCAWRIWYVNATAYSFETQEYGIGEWIPLNGDFFYSKEENTNGYSVRVREAEVVRYEDFMQRFGKPVDYLAENTQHSFSSARFFSIGVGSSTTAILPAGSTMRSALLPGTLPLCFAAPWMRWIVGIRRSRNTL